MNQRMVSYIGIDGDSNESSEEKFLGLNIYTSIY